MKKKEKEKIDVTKEKTSKREKTSKKVKSKQPKVNQYILNKIPYVSCYDDLGMIETTRGIFTRSYEIQIPSKNTSKDYDVVKVRKCMQEILTRFVDQFTCQMVVRNSTVDKFNFMEQILLSERKEEHINQCIEDYNQVIKDNIDIGHNNYKRTVYFVLSTRADTADDAFKIFSNIDEEVHEKFNSMYGYVAHAQTIEERLYTLYEMYNPIHMNYIDFMRERDFRRKKTKEQIAPYVYDTKNRDFIRLGDGKYIRMLFINSLPTSVPDTVLNDLMSVSSNSVLSVIYEPIDTNLGISTAARLVKENTKVQRTPMRETVEDRKNHRMHTKELPIREEEIEYFRAKANDVFQVAKNNNEPVMLASFVIGLYADNKEELDRDTKLLKLSASKYASQIRVCDLLQDEAFQSMLPLAQSKLNVYRTFRASQLAAMQPLNINELFDKNKLFYGLNSISDNLVLIDRKNYLSGIICGVSHSGKTFACKREIANTLMGTNDEVILISNKIADYEFFLDSMSGKLIMNWKPDVFRGKDANFKKLFLEAFICARHNISKTNNYLMDKQEMYKKIEVEVERLEHTNAWNDAAALINQNREFFNLSIGALKGYKPNPKDLSKVDNRFKVISVTNETELVCMLYTALNYAMTCKMQGKTVWVFVDSIDDLLYTSLGSDFLIGCVGKVEENGIPFTMVIDDSVHIITHQDAMIEYDFLMSKVNFYKLLSQGPIERRKYVERLNIPESLVTYITDREPGEGIIITPSANIAFNDRFENSSNPFYRRFYL